MALSFLQVLENELKITKANAFENLLPAITYIFALYF